MNWWNSKCFEAGSEMKLNLLFDDKEWIFQSHFNSFSNDPNREKRSLEEFFSAEKEIPWKQNQFGTKKSKWVHWEFKNSVGFTLPVASIIVIDCFTFTKNIDQNVEISQRLSSIVAIQWRSTTWSPRTATSWNCTEFRTAGAPRTGADLPKRRSSSSSTGSWPLIRSSSSIPPRNVSVRKIQKLKFNV